MNSFFAACGVLILLSGLFYLFPRKRSGGVDGDLERANLEWYHLRQAELAAQGDEALQEDAQLRLLEDEQQIGARARTPVASGATFPLWLLLPLVALASSAMYYRMGAATDVVIARQLQQAGESANEADMDALIANIERRAGQRPDNLHYQALLGRFYMGEQDYSRAARTYAQLAEQVPEDAQILAYAAQAQFLSADRELTDSARLRAEQALAINPHQRTALGLLGMASFEQGEYRAAVAYWERLLAMETPGTETARMIAQVIESAQQKLGEAPPAVAQSAPATQPAAVTAGVTVRVVLPDGAVVNRSDTVFVLARDAESGSRMPIAVQRLQAGQLPTTLRLDDNNSMAGQKLSQVNTLLVVVQVSPDGRPGEATASWLGQAGPLAPTLDTTPLEITLRPRGA